MRVLVVEDERRLAAALRHGLTAEGFTVDVAHDGVTGLARAAEQPYDVIVLDIMLPGLNGYRVCSLLRAAGHDAGILMLTAKDGEWDEAEALDTGADDFLSKPFSYVVLVARLRALARRIGSRAPRATVLGDLVVDAAGRTCTRAGTPVRLTAREFAVL
ncbi:response regulator transcription factor, partial [Kitasatospora sp. NPDC007106]